MNTPLPDDEVAPALPIPAEIDVVVVTLVTELPTEVELLEIRLVLVDVACWGIPKITSVESPGCADDAIAVCDAELQEVAVADPAEAVPTVPVVLVREA